MKNYSNLEFAKVALWYLLLKQQKPMHIWTDILIETDILSYLIKDEFGTRFYLNIVKHIYF